LCPFFSPPFFFFCGSTMQEIQASP
jgi:hypothetical protein